MRAPTAATMTIITTQLAAGVRLPLTMSLTTLSLMGSEPPLPRINSITPCQPRRPASVTMNDGKPSRVMIVPWRMPIAAQTASATRIAAHHGHPYCCFTSSAVMMPPMPLTKPIDKSISPRSSANTSPIASSM